MKTRFHVIETADARGERSYLSSDDLFDAKVARAKRFATRTAANLALVTLAREGRLPAPDCETNVLEIVSE